MTFDDFQALPVPEAGEGMRMSKEESLALVRPNAHRVLRKVRERADVSMEQAALAAGVPVDRFFSIENGSTRPTQEEVRAISSAIRANPRVMLETFGY